MKKIIAIVALVLTVLVVLSFIYLQPRLVPQLEGLTPVMEGISVFIFIAYLAIGICHLVFLKSALKGLTGSFWNSLFLAGVIFSGVTLLSDVVQLSEIGKEYLYWDVSLQWYFLYGFAVVHIAVAIAALIKVFRPVKPTTEIDGVLFVSLNQMILIACTLGLAGIILSSIWMPVALEYMGPYVIIVAGLSFAPVVVFILYWMWNMRKTKLKRWFDEKQISDIASGAVIAFVISLPIYLAAFATEALNIRVFQSFIWIMIIFFIQLGMFSAGVLFRTTLPED